MSYQVEVDEEVFAFVKAHAEPLVDTFNTALRRLLQLSSKPSVAPPRSASVQPLASTTEWEGMPTFPGGTPEALRQIIEVALLVKKRAYDRVSATKLVADKHKVTPNTVLDKYCRQLGLNTQKFDRLLDQPGLKELKTLLQSKFNAHADLIGKFL